MQKVELRNGEMGKVANVLLSRAVCLLMYGGWGGGGGLSQDQKI